MLLSMFYVRSIYVVECHGTAWQSSFCRLAPERQNRRAPNGDLVSQTIFPLDRIFVLPIALPLSILSFNCHTNHVDHASITTALRGLSAKGLLRLSKTGMKFPSSSAIVPIKHCMHRNKANKYL